MPNLLCDIWDDFKTIYKTPIIIVLLLLGCVALTIYIGGIYINPYVDDMPIVILDEDNSTASRAVIDGFSNSDRFTIAKDAISKDEINNFLENGTAQLGVYIPNGFDKDIKALRDGSVLLVTNGANVIICNNAYAAAAEVIQTISAGIQIKVLEGKGFQPDTALKIAMPFRFNDRILYDPRMTYMNYLVLGFIAIFFQQLMLSAMGQVFIQRGENLTKRNTYIRLFVIYAICFAIASISLVASFLIAKFAYKIPLNGNIGIVSLMFFLFGFAICAFSVLFSAIFKDKIKYSQFCYMLSLPTFASCGYVWPIDQIPQPLTIVIKLLWPLVYFSRNLDEYMIKGTLPYNTPQDMLFLSIFGVVWFIIAVSIFKFRYTSNTNLH